MMQELLNKMAGQEQDWQKMLDKLLIEMDSKVSKTPISSSCLVVDRLAPESSS